MRSFWKRTNRGLWLGAILLVLLIGFIVFKQVRFTLEKPQIRETAVTFVTELLEINKVPDAVPGKTLTEAQKKAQTDALQSLLVEYWMEDPSAGTAMNIYYFGGETLGADELEGILKEYQALPQNRIHSMDVSVPEREITIRADGTDRVSVEGVADVVVGMSGYDPLYGAGGLFPDKHGMTDLSGKEGIPQNEWEAGYAVSFDIEMMRTGKGWYVTELSINIYMAWSGPAEGGEAK